ncbi:MAG TPA: efflux RND transporter periplasmic adaptor subunit [Acetobacteraceae bacterium]|jgi:membrane fusion protein (multidrug efflux system)|nr:efflux RND transporter periplasmic adaptor subunit [Acetobacteraceae bacterium]
MIKRMVIMLAGVGIILGGFFAFQNFKARMIQQVMAAMANPPQTVSTTTAEIQEWQPQVEAVGSLRAVNGADLSLEVSGIVDAIDFKSGDDVAAGAVLLRLRSDDDVAKLQALQATAELAQITYDRDMKQWKAQAVSQQQVDSDNFNLKNARAQVEQQKAMVDKKVLRAPFAGHLGIRAVDVGQFLNAGTTVVTLQALDPIYADFFLPQQSLDQIRIAQAIAAKVDTYPGQTFAGKIAAINPQVDTSSRNVQMRATLGNPDRKLLPGMYATIDIDAGAPQSHVTLPQTAIAYNPYGSTVFIVEQKGAAKTVRQTFVTTGPRRGDQVAVLSGVKQGDVVVTAGQMKLHNGSPVAINNSVQPAADAAPEPTDH